MEINKALERLNQALDEVPALRKRSPEKKHYALWVDKVRNILELSFGKTSREYENFSRAVSGDYRAETFAEQLNKYNNELTAYENALKSAIHKGELLLEEKQADRNNQTLETVEMPPKAFISHGKGGGALLKLEKFIKELGIEPIVVKDRASADRTVDDKVIDYLNEADFVIIFATGDDEIKVKNNKGKDESIFQPRQNVIHEIGLAQKTHPGKIIYLLEEKAQFPSNIRPKVYEGFARQSMDDAFTAIVRELKYWGFLKVRKEE